MFPSNYIIKDLLYPKCFLASLVLYVLDILQSVLDPDPNFSIVEIQFQLAFAIMYTFIRKKNCL